MEKTYDAVDIRRVLSGETIAIKCAITGMIREAEVKQDELYPSVFHVFDGVNKYRASGSQLKTRSLMWGPHYSRRARALGMWPEDVASAFAKQEQPNAN